MCKGTRLLAVSQDFEAFRCKGLTNSFLGPRVREQVILSPRVQDNYAPVKNVVFYEKKLKITPKGYMGHLLRWDKTHLFVKTHMFLRVLGRLAGAGSVGGG